MENNYEVFVHRSSINENIKEVFTWHTRQGAFERLEPPWENVTILKREGEGVQDGTLLKIQMQVGVIKILFTVKHQHYIENEQFQDVQIQGPFQFWEHTHHFHPKAIDQTEIEDRIHYQWPQFLALMKQWLSRYLEKQLHRIFNYRSAILNHDLALHHGRKPMKILVSGSSGLVGSALIPFLTTGGHEVYKLVRHQNELSDNEISWDPQRGIANPHSLEGLDAVIHLAGDNISKGRWTEDKKRRIYDSRVQGTKILCRALANLERPPQVLISASAVGYYGNRGDEVLTENSHKGTGFLADVCEQWEEATESAFDKGIRVANLRLGVVLSPKGGALKQLLIPFKLGVGGPVGSGQQCVSWIAIDDLLAIIHTLLYTETLHGPINAVSPYPVTNLELSKTLGKVLHRPAWMKIPKAIARIVFGEMADELLLSSTKAIPKAMLDKGFHFTYANLEQALKHLLGENL